MSNISHSTQWPRPYTHRVSAFRSFQPELPVTARPSRSRQKQNIDLGKLHRFTTNVGIAPLTDHHGWNGEVFPCPFGFLYTSHSTFSLLISAVSNADEIAVFKKTGKCSHFVQFSYCQYVLKYFTRDMMNYHCLRVFRSRVKRLGKHSPGFSMFRTRVHGCSDAELCCVPIQSIVWAIFLLSS